MSKAKPRIWDCLEEGVAASTADAAVQTNDCSVPSSRKHRRIWDDYYDDDNDGIDENADAKVSSSSSVSVGKENAAPNSHSAVACDNIHHKIVSMKKEQAAKSQHLRQLKTDLAQRKVTNERSLVDLRASLQLKIDNQQKQHDNAMSSQRKLLQQIQNDCAAAKERAQIVSGEIQQIAASQQRMCRTLEVGGRRDLDKAKREWQSIEKNLLANLLLEKTAKMRQDAAKALEPELSAILMRNKKEKQSKRTDLMKETDEMRAKLQSQFQSQYAKACSSAKNDEERRLAEVSAVLQERREELSHKHADEVEKVRREWREQIQADESAFDADLRRREGDHVQAIADIRDQEAQAAQDVIESHRRAVSDLQTRHKETMEAEKMLAHTPIEDWKVQRRKELQNESDKSEKEAMSSLERKLQNEIELVSSNLQSEAQDNKLALEKEAEDHISAVQSSLELEIKAARRRQQKVADQANHAQETRDDLAKLVQGLQSKVSSAEFELSDVKQTLESAKVDADELENRSTRDLESAQSSAVEARDQAKREVCSMESFLKTLNEERARRKGEKSKTEEELRQRNEKELCTVKTRIGELLQRKRDKLQVAEETLKHKKSEAESLEKAIEEARILPNQV